jgi:hypothetical protein
MLQSSLQDLQAQLKEAEEVTAREREREREREAEEVTNLK